MRYTMRKRQRVIPYVNPPNLLSAQYGPSYEGHELLGVATVDCKHLLPRQVDLMIDLPDRGRRIINPCYHNMSYYTLLGTYFPDHETPDHQAEAFQHYGGPEDTTFVVPTASLVTSALACFPEFVKEMPWRRCLKSGNYVGWYKNGWKKPKLSLYRGFSVLNFAFEWRQNLDLLRSWFSRKGLISRYHRLMGANSRLAPRLQAIANERLAHVYGTKLFLQDARFLFDRLTRLNEQVAALLLRTKGVQRLYKRVPLDFERTWGLETRSFPVFGAQQSTLTLKRSATTRCRAVLYYTASAPAFKTFWTRLQQLSDSFGIRLDAGVVWDAIPYSFVVDWFINVGEYLHNNWSTDWFKLDIRLEEFCHSARIQASEVLTWNRLAAISSSPGYFLDSSNLIHRENVIYRRVSDDPPEIGPIELEKNEKGWSLNRQVNALALVAQKAHLPANAVAKRFFGYVD
jgi:hypothetical protein